MTWEYGTRDFLESDVIEWREAIWSSNRTRRKKRQPWGEQAVIGQILKIEGDFVTLMVLKVEIVKNTVGSDLPTYKVGATITKKRQTLLKGQPERLHWSEEEVRAALVADLREE